MRFRSLWGVDPAVVAPGQILARYRFVERLGEGGWAGNEHDRNVDPLRILARLP